MDHFVRLDVLPDGFTIPDQYRDRFRFDADTRRLYFQGFMSKADFDKLYLLSENWSYRRSLEELFRQSTIEPAGQSARPVSRIKAILSSLGLA
jgi:hypothetical protein